MALHLFVCVFLIVVCLLLAVTSTRHLPGVT